MDDKRYNPYVFGPPVQDPAFFFGRQPELTLIKNTIAHLAPGLRQSMAVVGPRRIGKSSLLLQLIRQLQETAHPAVYMSTEEIVPRSSLLLTQRILSDVRDAIKEKNPDTGSIRLDLLDGPQPSSELIFQVFQRDMQRMNDTLASKKGAAAVLMIDEVEGLLDFGGLPVLGMFRHLAQSLPYILFVVSGSDRLYYLINDTTSPFFNVFKTVTIQPLQPDDARAMILEPAQDAHLQFEPAAIDEIVDLSGGMPYLINLLAHYATEKMLSGNVPAITTQHVKAARHHVLTHEEGYFLYVWQQAQSTEKIILYALAVAQEVRTIDGIARDVEKIINTTTSIVQVGEYLKELVQRQVLRQDKVGSYSFSNQLLPMWLREKRTESQVSAESFGAADLLQPSTEQTLVGRDVVNRSGGVDISSGSVVIGGDVIGRDKVVYLRWGLIERIFGKKIGHTPAPVSLTKLREVLTRFFSESELRDLCFELGIDYESLGGEGKSSKARELIAYLERRDRLEELVILIRRKRPSAL